MLLYVFYCKSFSNQLEASKSKVFLKICVTLLYVSLCLVVFFDFWMLHLFNVQGYSIECRSVSFGCLDAFSALTCFPQGKTLAAASFRFSFRVSITCAVRDVKLSNSNLPLFLPLDLPTFGQRSPILHRLCCPVDEKNLQWQKTSRQSMVSH